MQFKDHLYHTVTSIRAKILQFRINSGFKGEISFVPTMGALHDGHLSLVHRAIHENSGIDAKMIIVSIFINPTQFGPNEDFLKYPRTLPNDLEKIFTDHVVKRFILSDGNNEVIVFAPSTDEIYPNQGLGTELNDFNILIPSLSGVLCGKSRPTHFAGVSLVVSKLFSIIKPDYAYFGAKDFQQTVIIRRLIEELFFEIRMVIAKTVREDDGLAMSSRNRYLSPEERKLAPKLYYILSSMQKMSKGIYPGTTSPVLDSDTLLKFGMEELEKLQKSAPFNLKVDYLEIVSSKTLQPVDIITPDENESIFAALAVYFGSTRLIDNIELGTFE